MSVNEVDVLSPEEHKKCIGYNTTRKYKLMGCAANPKQPLQLLYPGRFLSPNDNYNGSNIPHEDMEGLEKTRKMSQALRTAYDIEKEALSRHLGGNHPIYPHPAVEPDAIINDPRLSWVSLEFGGDPSFKNDEGRIPLQNPIEKARGMVKSSREENAITTRPKEFNGYHWENNLEGEYPNISLEHLPKLGEWSEGTIQEREDDIQSNDKISSPSREHFEEIHSLPLPKPKSTYQKKKSSPNLGTTTQYIIFALLFIFVILVLCFMGVIIC